MNRRKNYSLIPLTRETRGRQSALRKQREQLDARLEVAQAAKKKKTASGMNGAKLSPALSFWSM